MKARMGVHAVAVVVVGLVCWTLLSHLAFFAIANLGFPLRQAIWINESASGGPPGPWALWSTLHRVPHAGSIWAATYPTSDGGPTLAGVWVTVGVDTHVDVHVAVALDQLGRRRPPSSCMPWSSPPPTTTR
jgi:hypothetical protein